MVHSGIDPDDCKYTKVASTSMPTKEPLKRARSRVCSQTCGFICFVLVQGMIFSFTGNVRQSDRFIFYHLEIAALLILRNKINSSQSVAGLSGMTLIIYALVFGERTTIPLSYLARGSQAVEGWLPTEVTVGSFSCLLVLDILRAIFVTYKSTYQADIDTLKVQYLIPICAVLAFFLSLPHSWQSGPDYHYISPMWYFALILDMVALMPQLVMMSHSGGKIQVPIADFVAATFVAHTGDIIHTMLWDRDMMVAAPYVFALAVSAQVVNILLCADFMYYYCKAKSASSASAKEMELEV